jgi:hypothetical protein
MNSCLSVQHVPACARPAAEAAAANRSCQHILCWQFGLSVSVATACGSTQLKHAPLPSPRGVCHAAHPATPGAAHSWRLTPPCCAPQRIPTRIIEKAVWGMLPKGRLGNRIKLHLKVFKGDAHPHGAQQPVDITHLINSNPTAASLL